MKKLLLLIATLALVGAGCAKTPAVPANPTPETTTDQNGISTVTTDSGATLQVKQEKVPTSPQVTTGNEDVPVTDVFLGQPQEKYTMDIGNFFYKPNVLNVKAGDAVQVTFTNVVGEHTFNIDETDTHNTITQGSNITFVAPTKPGSYKFYCSIGNHRSMGMEGTINVK